MNAHKLHGLYAITSAAMCADSGRLVSYCEAAMQGGTRLLQYRDKHNSAAIKERLASVLLGLCRHFGVPFIINDDVELAARIGADGVHLGAKDSSIESARKHLGPHAIIGATSGDSLARAQAAASAGANYVAFGRFFPSQTKPDAPQARLELLPEARNALDIPICAIGGIQPENGAGLITAGADLLAVVEGVFNENDGAHVVAAARRYAALFDA